LHNDKDHKVLFGCHTNGRLTYPNGGLPRFKKNRENRDISNRPTDFDEILLPQRRRRLGTAQTESTEVARVAEVITNDETILIFT